MFQVINNTRSRGRERTGTRLAGWEHAASGTDRVSYVSCIGAQVIRFIFEIPSIIPVKLPKFPGTPHRAVAIKNLVAKTIMTVPFVDIAKKGAEEDQHVLILPYRRLSMKSVAFIMFRDRVKSTNLQIVEDSPQHELWYLAQ